MSYVESSKKGRHDGGSPRRLNCNFSLQLSSSPQQQFLRIILLALTLSSWPQSRLRPLESRRRLISSSMDSYTILDRIREHTLSFAFGSACALIAIPFFPIPILDRPVLSPVLPSTPVPELSATPSDLPSDLPPSPSLLPIDAAVKALISSSKSKRSSSIASLYARVTRRDMDRSMSTVSRGRPSFK